MLRSIRLMPVLVASTAPALDQSPTPQTSELLFNRFAPIGADFRADVQRDFWRIELANAPRQSSDAYRDLGRRIALGQHVPLTALRAALELREPKQTTHTRVTFHAGMCVERPAADSAVLTFRSNDVCARYARLNETRHQLSLFHYPGPFLTDYPPQMFHPAPANTLIRQQYVERNFACERIDPLPNAPKQSRERTVEVWRLRDRNAATLFFAFQDDGVPCSAATVSKDVFTSYVVFEYAKIADDRIWISRAAKANFSDRAIDVWIRTFTDTSLEPTVDDLNLKIAPNSLVVDNRARHKILGTFAKIRPRLPKSLRTFTSSPPGSR